MIAVEGIKCNSKSPPTDATYHVGLGPNAKQLPPPPPANGDDEAEEPNNELDNPNTGIDESDNQSEPNVDNDSGLQDSAVPPDSADFVRNYS